MKLTHSTGALIIVTVLLLMAISLTLGVKLGSVLSPTIIRADGTVCAEVK